MYKILTKNGQVIAFVTGVALIVIYFIICLPQIDAFDLLPKEEQWNSDIFNFGLRAVIAMVAICAILWLLFSLFRLVTSPKSAITGIITIGVLVVLFLVFKSMGSADMEGPISDTVQKAIQENNFSEAKSTAVSGALWTTIALAALAALSFLVSELINVFK